MESSTLLARSTFTLGAAALIAAQGLSAQELVSYPALDRLHDEAMAPAYTAAPGNLERAAWGHASVAFQRAQDDVKRFDCLRTQAELFEALGYVDGARIYLEEAARQAEATGDPFTAAMTWVDAAILAQRTGKRWVAQDLAAKARALVSNPALDLDQRATILDRLEPRS